MKKRQRLLSSLLALCMLFSMMPVTAFATDDDCEHTFDEGFYYYDEEYHYYECDNCSYYDEDSFEEHYDDGGGVCICGAGVECEHEFYYEFYYYDDEYHYNECDYCDYYDESTSEAHENQGDGTCVCGYEMPCEHAFDNGYYYVTDEGHYNECDYCDYYDEDSFEEHFDDGIGYCVCGQEVDCEHIYMDSYYVTDDGHYTKCDYCDYYDESTFEAHEDQGDGTCVCGYEVKGPVIVEEPQDVIVDLGEKFSITVKAEGEGLAYQWYWKDANMDEFQTSCIKRNTYSMSLEKFRIGREYYCVITDADGNSVTTDTVKSTVNVIITQQPEDVEVEIGEKFAISVSAVGEGLTYQWYYKNRTATEFVESVYTGRNYYMEMAEFCNLRQVYCVITDDYGNSVKTDTVTMSQPPKVELAIVVQPTDATVAMGEKFSVFVEAQGEGLTYQWYYRDGEGEWKVSCVKRSDYSMTMTNYRDGREYRCVITDMYGYSVTTDVASSICNKTIVS